MFSTLTKTNTREHICKHCLLLKHFTKNILRLTKKHFLNTFHRGGEGSVAYHSFQRIMHIVMQKKTKTFLELEKMFGILVT